MILALAGGVGGAKLACGLAGLLRASELTVVVNTGDDFTHCGLRISPDLDTVMYNLAGRNNTETGWGLAGETWHAMEALSRLGGPAWFRLGDQDIATHLERTRLLGEGATLSAATWALCQGFGLAHGLVPMSDDAVSTLVHTDEGPLEFQHYFVRRHCEPALQRLEFRGAASARPSPAFAAALVNAQLRAVVICPSNPYLSIEPILSLPGVRSTLAALRVPVIVVSPIIGGAAVKGPAAKIMKELGHEVSALEIARFYGGLANGIVIDESDRGLTPQIEAQGMKVLAAPTLMRGRDDQLRLAQRVLDFAQVLATAGSSKAERP